MANRVCKNKKCLKPLPDGYKHRYCEACRNQYTQNVKDVFKMAGSVAGIVACGVVTIATAKKIIPRNDKSS